MSYESFYGLKEAPFFNIPDERYFFSYPQNEKAMLKIIHALKRRMGLCLITAGIGTGKTMLSRKILELPRQMDSHKQNNHFVWYVNNYFAYAYLMIIETVYN